MSKKLTIIVSSILAVITSVLSFYFLCCLATGIFNKGQGIVRMVVMLTPGLAGILMPIELIVGLFFIIRLYKRPNAIKRFIKTYSITLIVLGVFGIIFAILAGVLLYHSFVEPSPFPYFLPLITTWHVLVIAFAIVSLTVFRKKIQVKNEDNNGTNAKHILFTIPFALIVYYALNRFGAFLISPFYIQWRSFDLTWPFYITLLTLIACLIQGLIYYFDFYNTEKRKRNGIIISSVIVGISLAAFIATGIIGYNEPLFLASISPAVPLERMLTIPIEYVIHALVSLLCCGYILYISISAKIKKVDIKTNTAINKINVNPVLNEPKEEKNVEEKKVEKVINQVKENEIKKDKVEVKEEKKVEKITIKNKTSKKVSNAKNVKKNEPIKSNKKTVKRNKDKKETTSKISKTSKVVPNKKVNNKPETKKKVFKPTKNKKSKSKK